MNKSWETPDFPITVCVPGEAEHSHDLNIGDLTVRPRLGQAILFHGVGLPRQHFRGGHGVVFLWPQELWVYLLEMTPYLRVRLLLDAVDEQAAKDDAKFGSENTGGIKDNCSLYKDTRQRRWKEHQYYGA